GCPRPRPTTCAAPSPTSNRARSVNGWPRCSTTTRSTRWCAGRRGCSTAVCRCPTTGTAPPGLSSDRRRSGDRPLLALVEDDVVDGDDVAVLRGDDVLEPREVGDRVVLRASHLRR